MTMHDHSLFESYVLDHFSTDRHNKVVQTTWTKIFWDFEGLGISMIIEYCDDNVILSLTYEGLILKTMLIMLGILMVMFMLLGHNIDHES